MVEVFNETSVDAALAASIFHYQDHGVNGVKRHLKEKQIPVEISPTSNYHLGVVHKKEKQISFCSGIGNTSGFGVVSL